MTNRGLTEAEILAAPKKDYMNEAQLQFFTQRLLSLRSQLLANLRGTSEHLRTTETASDPSDRATQEEEQAVELRTRDRERKLLKKLDEALERNTARTYGFCKDTGEPIGVGRLHARPTATLGVC
jgi:DnaK suppressor protein